MLILINMQFKVICYLYFAKNFEHEHLDQNADLIWKRIFLNLWSEELKQSLNDDFKTPLPHSINMIYTYNL